MMFRFKALISASFALLATTSAERLPLSTDYWKSSSFLKEFNGSYRINGAIEPVLTSEVRGLLVEMQDLMARGQREQAAAKLKASPLLQSSTAVQFNLANVLSELDQLDDAIKQYDLAIGTMPSFLRAHQNAAFAHFRKGDLETSEKHLLEAVRLGANNGSVHGLLGHCFLQKDQFEPALRSFREALITQPETMDWQLGIAQALQGLDRSAEALPMLTRLQQKSPTNNEIALQLALLHHSLDNTREATVLLELLRRRSALAPSFQLLHGTLLLGNGSTNVGAAVLREALQSDDLKRADSALNAILFTLNRGLDELAKELHGLVPVEKLSAAGKVNHTRLAAQIALASDPASEDAANILAGLISADPLDSHSLTLLGKQLVAAGRPHKALLRFDQAIHAEGSHSDTARIEKAQTLVDLQRYRDAIESLREYLASHPEDTRIASYIEQLARVANARSVGTPKQ